MDYLGKNDEVQNFEVSSPRIGALPTASLPYSIL